MSEDSLLDVRDLRVSFDTFDGEVKVLRGIHLELGENESLGLVGESGCGKTMTALSVMRMIPSPGGIVSGEIRYGGRDLASLKEKEVARFRGSHIAMIMQNPMTSLNPVFRVKDQMIDVIRTHSEMNRDEARQRALDLLRVVDISDPEDILENYPYQLSGGMSQRVMIAMAVSANPRILIADEPTTALDVTVEQQIMRLIRDVREEFRTSLIWITHDIGVVRQMCEKVAVMYAGTVVETGSVDDVLNRPVHPYTEALIKAIPSRRKRGKPLRQIKGVVPNLLYIPQGCIYADRCEYTVDSCRVGDPPQLTEVEPGRQIACFVRGGEGDPQ